MTLSQNEATRFISAIDYRIEKALGRGTVLEITYGDVDVVSGKNASALLGGDTNPSYGFRIPSGLNIESGDRVRVAIDPRGFRYIEEVLASTAYSKLEVDPVRGRVLLGDGSVAPVLGAAGQALVVDPTGTFLEWGDVDVAITESDGSFTVNGDLTVAPGNLLVLDDVALYRYVAETLRIEAIDGTEATVQIIGNYNIRLVGDTQPRIETLAASSKLLFSDGSNVADVNLYREAADVLKTDDNLHAVGNLRFGKLGALSGANKFIQTGTVSVSLSSSASGSQAVSFGTSFAGTPLILLNRTSGGSASVKLHLWATAASTTGFTANAATGDSTTLTGSVSASWIAIDPSLLY